jgi:hypothetical protein
MAAEDITLDELQAAIRGAGFTGGDDEGMTLDELSEAWKCARSRAHAMVRSAQRLGVLRVGKRASFRIDGAACRVPVYSFVIEKAKASTKRRTVKA